MTYRLQEIKTFFMQVLYWHQLGINTHSESSEIDSRKTQTIEHLIRLIGFVFKWLLLMLL